jgi:hypothetical protein
MTSSDHPSSHIDVQDIARRILFFISALEGFIASFLTYQIPGEISAASGFAVSPLRIYLIVFIALISVAFLFLSSNLKLSAYLRAKVSRFLQQKYKLILIFSLLLIFFLLYPPIVVRTDYSAYFQRLFYTFLFVLLIGIQCLLLFGFERANEVGSPVFFYPMYIKLKSNFAWIICLIFPFMYMTPRLWVFNGHQLSIGNDFVPFSYYYKVYILDFLIHFRLPLWSPSEAAGFPFLVSPQTGALYPLNIPLAVVYWWKGSYGLIDHVWWTVLGLSIFCVGLFMWLSEFNWKKTSALLAALIISVSYQTTEIIRFTKAVESICWLPWILYFVTREFKDPSQKKPLLFYFGFSFSIFSFLTAGYLYYQYYSIFLLIPYLFVLLINRFRKKMDFSQWKFRFSPFIKPICSALIPVILLIPYFLNMMVLLNSVYRRGTRDFFYSTEHSFSWIDHLGSLVYPPIAAPEGWYYFGILPLIFFFYYFAISKKDLEAGGDVNPWYLSNGIKIFLGVLLFFFVSISIGKESPLFIFLWNYFPFFYGFRYWGRFTLMFLPVISFVLAASIETVTIQLQEVMSIGFTRKHLNSFFKIGTIVILVIGASLYAHTIPVNGQWDVSFYLVDSRTWMYYLSLIIACLFLLISFSILKSGRKFSRFQIPIFGIVFFAVSIIDLFPIGAYQWLIDIIPEENPPRRINIAEQIDPQSFHFSRTIGKTNISITPRFSVGPSPDWYFRSYVQFFQDHAFEYEYRDILLGQDKSAKRIFFSNRIDQTTIKEFVEDSLTVDASYNLLEYNGEVLELDVSSSQDGYLSFIDNWDPFWTVQINGQPAALLKLFDTFKSVAIPAGRSIVRFQYSPQLFPLAQLTQTKQD